MTMIRTYLTLLFVCTLHAAPMAVAAGPGESDGGRRGEHGNRGEQRPTQRSGDAQDSGARKSGRGDGSNENVGGQRNNRLSPEERRALRRQIDEAGNDIYRKKR